MEIRYQYTMADFGPIMRRLRWANLRGLAALWTAPLLTAAAPMLVLSLTGMATLAGTLGVGMLAVTLMLPWMVRRHLRTRFATQCRERVVRLLPDCLEVEWELGWMRCGWSWPQTVQADRNWVAISQRSGQGQIVLAPRRAFADDGEVERFIDTVRRRIQTADSVFTALRTSTSMLCMSVDFELSNAEVRRIVERRFRDREQPQGGRFPLLLWIVVLSLLLVYLLWGVQGPLDDAVLPVPRWLAVAAAALTVNPIWWAIGPLRWWLLRRSLGESDLFGSQRALLWSEGIEQRGPRCQSLARWNQIMQIIDGQQFIVFQTLQGSVFAVPRRAFADQWAAEQFLTQARQLQLAARQAAEESDEAGVEQALPPLVESDNPYQPPSM